MGAFNLAGTLHTLLFKCKELDYSNTKHESGLNFLLLPCMVASSCLDKLSMSAEQVLTKTAETKLLTKLAQSGILSKAEAAGLTLADLEPLLKLADDTGVVAITGDLLESPLAPTLVDLAPAALPLLGPALELPPAALVAAAGASVAAAFAEVAIIPDDSIVSVATQTGLAVILGAVLPAVSLGGAFVISSIKK